MFSHKTEPDRRFGDNGDETADDNAEATAEDVQATDDNNADDNTDDNADDNANAEYNAYDNGDNADDDSADDDDADDRDADTGDAVTAEPIEHDSTDFGQPTDAASTDVIDGEVVDETDTDTESPDATLADDRQMSDTDEAIVVGDNEESGIDETERTEIDSDNGFNATPVDMSPVDMSRVDQEPLLEDETDDDGDATDGDEADDVDRLDTDDDDELAMAEPVMTSEPVVAPVVVVDEPADQDACATPDDMDTVSDGTAGLGNATAGDMRPGDAPVPGADAVDVGADGLHDRWQQAQLGFIDDPRSSTADAHAIASDAVDAHITALRDRLTALDGWQQESTPDTEVLRAAMQGYRALIDALTGTTH